MFVAYVDDSGDSNSFALGAVLVDADHWLAALDQLIAFRAQLSRTIGFRMRHELKATRLVTNGGPWRKLQSRGADPTTFRYLQARSRGTGRTFSRGKDGSRGGARP